MQVGSLHFFHRVMQVLFAQKRIFYTTDNEQSSRHWAEIVNLEQDKILKIEL